MKLITLSTDFGFHDPYAGVMKGVILSRAPEARIVDLCHAIRAHDVQQAAYMIAANYRYFPAGSIHVLVVDPGVGSQRRIILLSAGGHYFLAPDNGVLSLVAQESHNIKVFEAKRPDLYLHPLSQTFHGRDIFAPLAAYLALNNSRDDIGPELELHQLRQLKLPQPAIDHGKKQITGAVVDIDHFGNIITNINRDNITELTANPEEVVVTLGNHSLRHITISYDSVPIGQALLIFNSTFHLEIAINQGRASDYFQIKPSAKVLLQMD